MQAMAPSNPMIYSWLPILYFLVVLAAVTCSDGWLGRILRARALVGVGIIAYGLYMFHQAVSGLLYAFLRGKTPRISCLGDLGILITAAVLTFVLAKLSWTYFERPLIGRSRSYVY